MAVLAGVRRAWAAIPEDYETEQNSRSDKIVHGGGGSWLITVLAFETARRADNTTP
jgi:hypothetical protein